MNARHPRALSPANAAAHAIVGSEVAHDSAALHVAGAAHYTNDLPEPRGTLYLALGTSPLAHGRLRSVDLAAVRAAPGVVDVITAADIPGINDVGPIQHDDPVFADDLVQFVGQPVFAVAATSVNAARRAARLARFDIEPLPPILTIAEAMAAQSFVLPPVHVTRGDAAAALARAPHRLQGTVEAGGQDHFYLEGQIALAIPREHGGMQIYTSTQHPGEVQHMVAHVLGIAAHDVVVECRRMGGGFGGKETQMSLFACAAALVARRTGRAAKLRLDRDEDMRSTGKRHAFAYQYDVGFDAEGRILGIDLTLASRCGFSADLSGPVNDRAVFHADNTYWLPDVALHSFRCKTNTVSDTAFRGFGGPQGMFPIEHVIDEIARALGRDPLDVRLVNLYGTTTNNVTPFGMTIEDNIAPALIAQLEQSSRYRERRHAIAAWNVANPVLKRGIALTPVKFGISFTATHYNQAGALLHLYNDGTLLLNHGGTEMGQGLFTKVAQVVAQELGVALATVRVSASDTSKVPNASPTAASSGSDLNGMAARDAARTLRARLVAYAARKFDCDPQIVDIANGIVTAGNKTLPFAELAHMAYMARVQLSATGFYATPKIHYDRKTLSGRPFFYYAYGAAVAEVAVDTLTGEHRLLAVDILHDVGTSLNPALDRGQIEGGFVQGWGWLALEELWWNDKGELKTYAPSTYKIPTAHDVPAHFNIEFFDAPNREDTIYRSKAVGEPPFMLALAGFQALRDAIASVGRSGLAPHLDAPATDERILASIDELRARVQVSMAEWLATLRERVIRDGRAVLVTVAHTTGSAPRAAGTAMVVSAADAVGTIGGGHLEFEAMRIARDALASTAPLGAWIVRFPLAARLGQCCGGVATLAFNVVHEGEHGWLDAALACLRTRTVFALVSRIGSHAAPLLVSADNVAGTLGSPTDDSAAIALARQRVAMGADAATLVPPAKADGATLLVHIVRPQDFRILVFGNGHVGRALAQVLGTLDASVRWIDGREQDFPPQVPHNVEAVITDDPVAELDAAPHGAWVLIMTHSHALDFELTHAALQRDDWAYLGLIGSLPKRNQFAKRLAARGVANSALARIVCPIGARPGIAIRSKEPGAIAVAVAAELLALREALAARDGVAGASTNAGASRTVDILNRAHSVRTTTHRTQRS